MKIINFFEKICKKVLTITSEKCIILKIINKSFKERVENRKFKRVDGWCESIRKVFENHLYRRGCEISKNLRSGLRYQNPTLLDVRVFIF